MSSGPNPIAALDQLEAWLTACAWGYPAHAQALVADIRTGLRAWLDEPPDPLDDAAGAIRRAEYAARQHPGHYRDALVRELAQAASSLARARALRG